MVKIIISLLWFDASPKIALIVVSTTLNSDDPITHTEEPTGIQNIENRDTENQDSGESSKHDLHVDYLLMCFRDSGCSK